MSISRYIDAAVTGCSAFERLPAAAELADADMTVGDRRAHAEVLAPDKVMTLD
jgi:hypothetical protein